MVNLVWNVMFVRQTFATNLFLELISSFFTLTTGNVNVESSFAIVNVTLMSIKSIVIF